MFHRNVQCLVTKWEVQLYIDTIIRVDIELHKYFISCDNSPILQDILTMRYQWFQNKFKWSTRFTVLFLLSITSELKLFKRFIKSLSYRDDWIYSATDSQTALLTGVRANSHKRHLTRAISLYDRHTRIVRIFQSKQRILNRFIAGKRQWHELFVDFSVTTTFHSK